MYKNANLAVALAARRVYKECTEEVQRLSGVEKKNLLLSKFHNFQVNLISLLCLPQCLIIIMRVQQVRVTSQKFYKFVLHVGSGENMHVVCRTGFAKAYNVSAWYIDNLVTRLKKRKCMVIMCLHACL